MNSKISEKYPAVPLLDLAVTYQPMQAELEAAVLKVMRETHYILGPQVAELETRIAAYCQTNWAVGVASGSDALLLAMMALNIGPADEVITTPFTFLATASSIARLGAKPVFVDVDPRTFNILPEQLAAKITAKTKAIIPVHLFGQCAPLDEILEIARTHKLAVIEDAAQAIGATYKGKLAGSLGDFGCFSFFPSKNLGGAGDAGIITTNNPDYARLLKSLRVHGSEGGSYYYKFIGCNSRLDTLQAAIILVKLNYLESWHQQRRQNAARYSQLLQDVAQVKTPYIEPRGESVFNQYTLIVEKRDELKAFLSARNITTGIYYPWPLHLQECFRYLGYQAGDFPNTEYLAAHVISLPIYPGLTPEMGERVAASIKEFYQ